MALESKSLKTALACVALLLVSTLAFAQNKVSGKVTDPAGEPLPGVAVVVRGTTLGTITDPDGSYSIQVKNGETLEFSSIGLVTQTFLYDGSYKTKNVVMEEDKLFLDELVVVGYGTQKKSSMTSAVSAISGGELMKAPSTNVSQLLGGKLPGISSVQESGEPGLDQAVLRIRGSVYGVAYVVDGFPVDNINDIDPNDIESVSVLKDGASAAVYGLKASGGVIIITTRKGQKGAPKIPYNVSLGASLNANFPQFMDGPQFAYYYNVADMMDKLASGAIKTAEEYTPYFTQEQVALMKNGDPTDGYDNVNYIDKVYGTGFNQKHNVTVQGGTDKVRYFASFGYLGQKGNIDNYNYTRYNIRSNVEATIANNFVFTLGLSGVLSNRQTPAFSTGGSDTGYESGWLSIANQTIQMHPYLPEKYNGKYTASIKKNTSLPQSPLAAIYESGYKKTRSTEGTVNASLAYNAPWLKGLQIKVSGSFDYGTSFNKNLNTPYYLSAFYDGAYHDMSDPRGVGNGNELGEGTTYSQSIDGQASIAYVNSFDKHNVDVLVLGEVRDYISNAHSAYAKKLPFASLPELSNGTPADNPISGWSGQSRSAGFVFRARYNYAEKYLAEFTGRYDGSYKFAGMANTRWGFFPSGSIGWVMSKEDWMKDVTTITNLKLRASVGLLGADNASAFSYLSTYSQWKNVILANGSTQSINPAYYASGVPNPNLTWEKNLSYNIGFDLDLWRGMLAFEVDGFYNHTFDMLTYQGSNFSPSMGGYYPSIVNKNAIDTKGIDVLVSHRHSVNAGSKPLIYGISASVTYAKSRWLIYPDSPNDPEGWKLTGKPVGSFLAWIADGLYKSEEEIDNSAWFGTRPCVGDIKYRDLNGDGTIDYYDKTLVGRPNRPQVTYGLNFDIAWNGIDFNCQFTGGALFDVSLTGTYYNGNDDNTVWTQTFKEGANSPLFLVQNAYSIYNTEGTFPRLTLGATGHGGDNGLASTFWLRDGRYLRLKTCQLGYTLPSKLTQQAKIEAIRFFVEGQNLFTLSGLPQGIDPESPGVNNGYYPQQRLLMGGLTLTF